MQDRPNKIELLHGVEYFLTDEAIPQLEEPSRFHARVAANVVRMLIRELEGEEDDLRSEFAGLAELLDGGGEIPGRLDKLRDETLEMNERLAEKIRRGEADDPEYRERLLAHLKGVTVRKLDVTDPAMSELARMELGKELGIEP